jgi:hypothetical protein
MEGLAAAAWVLRGKEASVPMVLMCQTGISEGKPQVEGYAVDELVAMAESAVPGLGRLAGMLAALAGGLTGPGAAGMSFEQIERQVAGKMRVLACAVFQHVLDARAGAEARLPGVAGADGVRRTLAERGHARTIVTTLGPVRVRRIAYRARVKGVPALFPRDAALNLPPRRYSWPLQQLAVLFTQAGSYEQARQFVRAATGVSIGKRQLEQITAGAAADAAGFYPALAREPGQPEQERQQAHQGQGQEAAAGPVVISPDAKGVAMRPEARRRRGARAPGQRVRNFEKRRGTGEKGHKRMAQAGCVFDVRAQAGPPRTPEQIMTRETGQDTPPAPEAAAKWYTADITAGLAETIRVLFDQASRRDPGHARTWIALADGDNHQIGQIQDQAAQRGVTVTILIDFAHVLQYLWRAAWCFHRPRDPAIEAWVTARGADILHGRVAAVIARIQALAAAHPPRPGGEHDKIIRKTLTYLDNKRPYLDYPRALANGWPIATGVIEGACRHLIGDRMGITGARWGIDGAQAILSLRAIRANGDLDDYWNYHIAQEHQRNHLSRYQHGLELAA